MCQTWMTAEQKYWLEAWKQWFLKAKQNETTFKEFFPTVTNEFCEKWPMPPVTEDEISSAGSADLVMKTKWDNSNKVHNYYFKKKETDYSLCNVYAIGRYHNNTCSLNSHVGGGSVLKMKGKLQMLQSWQAY